LELQVVDLDSQKDTLISVTYLDERRVLGRSEVIELLALKTRFISGELSLMPSTPQTVQSAKAKTLASLGAILGPLLNNKEVSERDQERLLTALKDFDGNAGGRRSSQVGHWLRDLLQKKLMVELKEEVVSFLKRYPELEKIPRR